jgi:hypothetical protein
VVQVYGRGKGKEEEEEVRGEIERDVGVREKGGDGAMR